MRTRRKEYEFTPAADKTTMHDVAMQIWNTTKSKEQEEKVGEPISKANMVDDSLAKTNAFTGVNDTNKKRAAIRAVQRALNIEIAGSNKEDGELDKLTKAQLNQVRVAKGEKSYLVSAALLLLAMGGKYDKEIEMPAVMGDQFGAELLTRNTFRDLGV